MSTTTIDALAEQHFLGDVLQRLKRRRLMIVSLTLLVFLLAAAGIEMLPRSYRAVASVAIENQTPTAEQAGSVLHDTAFDDQTIGTEQAILQSRELLTDAIKQVGLVNKPEFNRNLRPTTLAGTMLQNLRVSLAPYLPNLMPDIVVAQSDQAMADTLDTLRKHIQVSPMPHSRVIDVAVTANNNELAAQIANSIANLYIVNHRDYRMAASQEAHQFLDSQISGLRTDADSKAAALERYRIDNGLTTVTTATLVQQQEAEISTQLQAASTRLADLQAQQNTAAHSTPTELAAVLASPTIAKLREQESIIAAQRGSKAVTYGGDSPVLVSYDAQLAAVRRQIADEARRSVKSLPNDVASAQAAVASLTKRLADLRQQGTQMDEARAHLATLQADATTASNVLASFLGRLREIDASMAYGATDVRVISHAAVPIHASFPNELIMLPSGFVLALLLSCTLGYLTTKPKGLIGTTDIETRFDIRPLGMIPLRTSATMPIFETAIEQLLNRIIIMDDPPRSVLITSALPAEGKTTTAQALAGAALRRGMKVVLVDADMRSQLRLKQYSTVPTMGLGDVLRGEVGLEDVVKARSAGSVPMLPAGSPRGNPTRLMALPTLRPMMATLAQTYDLVIIDAPPALVGGDVEMLTRAVDTTMVLAKWHSTAPQIVAEAIKQLGTTKIAGIVLTMVDPDKITRFGQSDSVVFSKPLYRYYKS